MTKPVNGSAAQDVGPEGVQDQRKPHPGEPERDLNMRIAADGTWYYQNSPINRMPLVKLFASVLRREKDGSFWLVTPVERGRIEVEDAPFIAVDCESEGEGRGQTLHFTTNLDQRVTAGQAHPLRVAEQPESGEPKPYVEVRPGLEALITRAVFYRLVELAVPADDDESILGLWSSGRFFPLGRAS